MAEFSTGQAARALRIPQSYLRALCQAGLIAARSTDGGHWRIPKAEVDRLRREGIPELPDLEPEPEPEAPPAVPAPNPKPHPALLAEPSKETVAAADQVVRLENEVKALHLKRAKEEASDWFRERQRQQAGQQAAGQQRALQRQAGRVRQEWEAQWVSWAIDWARAEHPDLPRVIELDVSQTVEDALGGLGPAKPRYLVERIVCAAVDKGLQPWRRNKEIEQAIELARQQLPTSAQNWWHPYYRDRVQPSEWETRAIRAAADAIKQVRPDGTFAEIRAAATEAGRRVRADYERQKAKEEHRQACEQMVACVLRGEDARAAVRKAIERLPVGASHSEMAMARDAALAPFGAAAEAEQTADRYLEHVREYAEELGNEETGEWDLGGLLERAKLAEKLAKEIRPRLIRELVAEPAMDEEEARGLIEKWIDGDLGLDE
jgi:excisionase family DNA binding protein